MATSKSAMKMRDLQALLRLFKVIFVFAILGLTNLGCGSSGGADSLVTLNPPSSSPSPQPTPTTTPTPPTRSLQVSLGKSSRLLRAIPTGQVLFPELAVKVAGDISPITVTVEASGRGTLLNPGPGPKNTSVLDAEGKELTFVFTAASGEEITEFLRRNLKATTTFTGGIAGGITVQIDSSTPGRRADFQVTVNGGGLSATGEERVFFAVGAGALDLSFDPGTRRIVNEDTGRQVAGSRPQDAIDAIAGGTNAQGSILKLKAGVYTVSGTSHF